LIVTKKYKNNIQPKLIIITHNKKLINTKKKKMKMKHRMIHNMRLNEVWKVIIRSKEQISGKSR